MQLRSSRDEVERSICEAFANVQRPQTSDVAPHDCPECAHLRKFLSPHEFADVPDKTIDNLSNSLPLLGSKGLHYYLPAYLLRALHDPNYRGIDLLVYHLAPSDVDIEKNGPYWPQRLTLFSPAQRQAILSFVDWLATTGIENHYPEELARARNVWAKAA